MGFYYLFIYKPICIKFATVHHECALSCPVRVSFPIRYNIFRHIIFYSGFRNHTDNLHSINQRCKTTTHHRDKYMYILVVFCRCENCVHFAPQYFLIKFSTSPFSGFRHIKCKYVSYRFVLAEEFDFHNNGFNKRKNENDSNIRTE